MKPNNTLKSQLFEVIYTPESLLRHTLKVFKQMWRDLLASRELARRLMVRDISAQLLVTVRELATTGVVSDPWRFWIASVITIVSLLLTWIGFRLAMPFVVERVSS